MMKTINLSFILFFAANAALSAGQAVEKPAADAQISVLKEISLNLLKQNENLDNIFDMIDDSGGKLSPEQLKNLEKSVSLVKKSAAETAGKISSMLLEIKAGKDKNMYARLIKSDSRLFYSKVNALNRKLAKISDIKTKSLFRDAPSSKRGKRKGRKLSEILSEYDKVARISIRTESLKKVAKKLNAAAKWLEVVSR